MAMSPKKQRRNKNQERQQRAGNRAAYPSDLTEKEWQLIAPLFLRPKKDGRGRPPGTPFREIVNALGYLSRTGCQWRYLPHDFPEWDFVYQWFRQWCGDGTFVEINRLLGRQLRIEDDRDPNPSLGIIDAQSVKSTAIAGVRGFDGGKKVKGVKRHIVVDTLGIVLIAVVHTAGIHDYQGAFLTLCPMFPSAYPRLVKILADAGYGVYGSALGDWLLSAKGWVLEIVHRVADGGFHVLRHRWKVERTFAWLGRHRRLSRHYEQLSVTAEGMIYLASIRIMLHRLTVRRADFHEHEPAWAS
jgi:putative transposase